MRLGYGLIQEQTQKLIMTPQLRQAIAILQMSTLDLCQFVEQQLQENPLLESVQQEDGIEQPASQSEEQEEMFDIDWQDYFQDSSDLGNEYHTPKSEKRTYNFEDFITEVPCLTEHLNGQLAITQCPPAIVPVVKYLIGNLDHKGYLKISLDEVTEQLHIEYRQAKQALDILQKLEPAGIGARTLEECLLLQVRFLNLENQLLEQLIKHHLDDVASGRYSKIADKLGVTLQQVQQAVDQLRLLDPKPARNFSGVDDTRYIVPDVVVEKVEGQYIVLVNDTTVPRLRVNNVYKTVVKQGGVDNDTRKYVENKLNGAMWLIRGIEQRRLTLYRVASTLVALQCEFLDKGVKYLRPLVLRDVAQQLELHESTVSRATSGKYMQTPQGVFEMKYFFSTGIKRYQGNEVSTESIKKTLQELIEGEDAKKPLSDQKIANIMQQKGIKISRRTITKYRDELGIPATSQRKRY